MRTCKEKAGLSRVSGRRCVTQRPQSRPGPLQHQGCLFQCWLSSANLHQGTSLSNGSAWDPLLCRPTYLLHLSLRRLEARIEHQAVLPCQQGFSSPSHLQEHLPFPVEALESTEKPMLTTGQQPAENVPLVCPTQGGIHSRHHC